MLATQISMFDLDAALTMAVDASDSHEEREEENDESKVWRLLEQVPTVEGGGDTSCAVCSEGLRFGGAAKRIPCGHVFHQDCILRWLTLIYSCPFLMYQGGGTPECYCGAGKMELRCAGPKAMNAGRYYLKCPANDNHPKSFMWFDEFLHDNKRRNKEVTGKHIREGRPAAVRDHRCSKGSRAHGTQSSSNTEMKVNVLLCLVCLLLVAACILIGKLM
ncbi:hypothetical protein SASPL_129362 [Salvia splendens]|uniref:RING-type domain-containing protein n=1 Tax=Salvia splendens TaxID=180675 RepID=A0A8X8ZPD2_SALSN|nr:hypothetical protein SASPL_129362 [Salvia splendens]